MNSQNITKDIYIYTASVSNLAASGQDTDVINIEADANFVWLKAAYFADVAGAAQTQDTRVIPLVNISITDSGSGRNLQAQPVPINTYGGVGALPFVLPVARSFRENSSILVTFQNFSAATTYANVIYSFIGYKAFRGRV